MLANHARLIDYLAQAEAWVTAAELADKLGVTTRSVRSYVTAVKSSALPLEVIESSTSGYRLNRDNYAEFLKGASNREAERPRDRQYHLVRRLGDAPEGTDIHALADSFFVSESTIEADLRKIKAAVEESGLTLARRGPLVILSGTEPNLRRLLSKMFRHEESQGFLELESIQREFESSDLRSFKTSLLELLDSHGYFVNEYGINHVLLHVAIAADRTLPRDSETTEAEPAAALSTAPVHSTDAAAFSDDLAELITSHFGANLREDDLNEIELLLTTRVITRAASPDSPADVDLEELTTRVRRTVKHVGEEYLIDLDDDDFIMRLSLHVRNLILRAQDLSYSRNPMTRSIKTTYPMIYELAVFIAAEVQRDEGITIHDDEISYIALHVGSHLERQAKREVRLTAALVCPNYHDLHVILRERIEAVLGDELQLRIVITRTDVDLAELSTDLVLTTIDLRSFADNVVLIQPFLTETDVDAIRRTISRIRRLRRRRELTDELLRFFDPALFLRNFTAPSEEAMIAALGHRMIEAGVIDHGYITGAIERERMSSTAFTDTLAVPHAMTMNAHRTAISIVINETPMPWGENKVNVIALIAFSAAGRTTFQTVFDQFVTVFSDRDYVQQLVKKAVDFPTFIDELVRGIES
ncbi:transcription antiterminator [Salinibacterium sp. NSLL150]|uniref:BglG family transcription antiterminator n=1 Tax=unclassified Salinibacterium TaxID=2632331 RepID=UPI0018CC7DFA|nr:MULTISPECIES: PTS sugar transporter subunit IIA [unclassified Salinibacterium]MBH0098249.1 transcription antiterminator [Salinibacterium sp. NSLL35]MBH0101004.1 transcription antiterminator [Salinibacterium sp. NSLL150]MBH0103763.1 transcription antiterminator [Salinibacterium sp. NSLL16]MBH0106524.1 transcription antiterminator [Salinibacterium sp. NSLL17]MBH0109711.1 transcription antiterminator [Salinibacterium sp. NG22]